jgi:hypothetical protein
VGPLLSVHLTSNRPEQFVTFLDRLEHSTDDLRAVEVVVKIDDADQHMNRLLTTESARRPFRVTYLSTPLSGGFYELWRSYDELLRATDPDAYFVVGLNDEMYFTEKGWDTRLRKYVGLYPDHIYRLRTSIHRERNTYDYWEALCAGDLTPIMTKRWLDLSGGWCPCNGPDTFQNSVAFYFGWLYRHDTFNRPYRERVVHDVVFGGYGANVNLVESDALRRRMRGGLTAWFTLVSYRMQLEAARRAQILHGHIAAAQRGLVSYRIIDAPRQRSLRIVDEAAGAVVWQASYRLNRWRVGWTNTARKFNYPYYGGAGDTSRRRRWSNIAYYLQLRHAWLDHTMTRIRSLGTAATVAALRYVLPTSRRRRNAQRLFRDAGMFIREGDWNRAREAWHLATTIWPDFGAPRLTADGAGDVADTGGSESARMHALRRHLTAPTFDSCREALGLMPLPTERLATAWLQFTLERPFNLWTVLPSLGIRRVALFGGEGWGRDTYEQLQGAGVACVGVIDNNPGIRKAAMIAAPYFSQAEFLASGHEVDAVLSTLRGDHDRELLPAMQREFGPGTPVISWKMLFLIPR